LSVADESLELREKVAQASWRSVFIARKHCDLGNNKGNVHAARDYLKFLAGNCSWFAFLAVAFAKVSYFKPVGS